MALRNFISLTLLYENGQLLNGEQINDYSIYQITKYDK